MDGNVKPSQSILCGRIWAKDERWNFIHLFINAFIHLKNIRQLLNYTIKLRHSFLMSNNTFYKIDSNKHINNYYKENVIVLSKIQRIVREGWIQPGGFKMLEVRVLVQQGITARKLHGNMEDLSTIMVSPLVWIWHLKQKGSSLIKFREVGKWVVCLEDVFSLNSAQVVNRESFKR